MSRASPLAGFEVTINGRIWVTPEGQAPRPTRREYIRQVDERIFGVTRPRIFSNAAVAESAEAAPFISLDGLNTSGFVNSSRRSRERNAAVSLQAHSGRPGLAVPQLPVPSSRQS
jgi:hypothetical protein